MQIALPLACVLFTFTEAQRFGDTENEDFRVKLTAERLGPPLGAQFSPISVVTNVPDPSQRPVGRPFKGRPPPPPPRPPLKPTRRPPRPTFGPVAPPPLPVPASVNMEVPQRPDGSGNIPPLPLAITVATQPQEIRPELETVATTPRPAATTTPNTNDAAPAIYSRFKQNDDGSYFFDFEAINHIKRFEQGFFKRDSHFMNPILVKTGMYSFISPEGVPFRTDYVADERGYRTFDQFQANPSHGEDLLLDRFEG